MFLDPDPVEDDLGKTVDLMNADELSAYLRMYLQARHGAAPPMDGFRERSVMTGLQSFYGRADAGRIVKWACWHHDAKFRGQCLGYFSFSKKMRWLTDLMFMEMQDHLRRTAAYDKKPSLRDWGISTGEDLL